MDIYTKNKYILILQLIILKRKVFCQFFYCKFNKTTYCTIRLICHPPKTEYFTHGKFDDRRYYFAVRAITWATAHEDIKQQKLAGVVAKKFRITGVSYDKNKDNKGYFRSDAPPEIKALANNLLDKTNPLWDRAMGYINEPEFVYKIKSIEVD